MTLVSAATLASNRSTYNEELNHRNLIQIRPDVVPYRDTQRVSRLFGLRWEDLNYDHDYDILFPIHVAADVLILLSLLFLW